MNVIKRFARNTVAIFISQVVEPLCSFVLILLIARHLGASALGNYATAFSFFFIFSTISSLGYAHLITREVARDRSKAGLYLVNASLVGCIFSLITTGAMGIIALLFYSQKATVYSIWILGIALVPGLFSLVFNSICRGLERLDYVSISSISADLFRLGAGTVILLKGYGLLSLMAAVAGSYFVNMGVSLYFVLKCIGKQDFKIDLNFCKWIILTTPTFALIFVFATIYWNVDVIMLSKLKGPAEVGLYTAAYKLMNVWKIIPVGYLMVLQPLISRWFESSRDKFRIACVKSINYLLIIMVPVAFATTVLSKSIILLFYTQSFLASASALAILVWALVPYTINMALSHVLVASNNQKINLYSLLISMISNVILNFLLIRSFSFVGASLATLISICVFLALQYGFVSRKLFKLNFIEMLGRPFASATLMVVLILIMRPSRLLLIIPLSAGVYFLSLVFLRAFSAEDWQLFRKLWVREKRLTIP